MQPATLRRCESDLPDKLGYKAMETKKPFNPSQAVVNAKQYIRDLDPDEQFRELLLEEIVLDEEGVNWLITLGYYRQRVVNSSKPEYLQEVNKPEWKNRVYKQLIISAENGDFIGMRIRDLNF